MKTGFIYWRLFMTLGLACLAGPVHGATVAEVANLKFGPERQRALQEGARSEGKLMIYATSSGYKEVAAAFMKEFPFVKVDVFTSRGEPLTQRVLAEAKAGRLGADVLRTNVDVYANLDHLLAPFKSPNAKFDLVPKAAPYSFGGVGFTYSKERVKEADIPKEVEDLLAPRWKGRIGLFVRPNNYPGRWVGTLLEILGEEQTKSFLKKLGDQDPHFYVRPAAGRSGLLSGEFDVNMQGLTSGYVNMIKGEPSGILALDPTNLSSNLVGVFEQSKNPHAALLFIDWVLGKGAPIAAELKGEWTPAEVDKRQKGTVKLPGRIRIEKAGDSDHLKSWMAMFQQLVAKK